MMIIPQQKKRPRTELGNFDKRDRKKKISGIFSHLTDSQKYVLRNYILNNPEIKGRKLSLYATSQGFDLNTQASYSFILSYKWKVKNCSYLTDNESKMLRYYVQKEKNISWKKLCCYAKEKSIFLNYNIAKNFIELNKFPNEISKTYIPLLDNKDESTAKLNQSYEYEIHNGMFKGNVELQQNVNNNLGIQLFVTPQIKFAPYRIELNKNYEYGPNNENFLNYTINGGEVNPYDPSESVENVYQNSDDVLKRHILGTLDINGNITITREELSQYANSQGINLNNTSAPLFLTSFNKSVSLVHLSNAERDSLNYYILNNRGITALKLKDFALTKMIFLNIKAANRFIKKHKESILYSHFLEHQKDNLKFYIQENPKIKCKQLIDYAITQGYELNVLAADSFLKHFKKSKALMYLSGVENDYLKSCVLNAPDIDGKKLSQLALIKRIFLNYNAADKFIKKIKKSANNKVLSIDNKKRMSSSIDLNQNYEYEINNGTSQGNFEHQLNVSSHSGIQLYVTPQVEKKSYSNIPNRVVSQSRSFFDINYIHKDEYNSDDSYSKRITTDFEELSCDTAIDGVELFQSDMFFDLGFFPGYGDTQF